MQDFADKLNLTRNQLFGLIGFVVILLSIPLSFSLARSSQVFRSRADELKKTATSSAQIKKSPVTQPLEVPATSPLSELEQPAPTPDALASSLNTAFGPTLNVKINLEGRPAGDQSAKVFIGIAQGTPTGKPTYVLSFTVDFPASGEFKGLSLAGLNPGSTYTAYVKGPAQIDSSSTFTMSPTETNLNNNLALLLLSGDLNEDNTINSADYTVAKAIYGATASSANWNARADLNQDGVINNLDLVYITKNTGKTGASSIWYSSQPVASGSASLTTSGSATPATGGPATGTTGGPARNASYSDAGGPARNASYSDAGGPARNASYSDAGGYWFWMPAI
ncbi:hypothetical protein A3A14_01515 [Candidatus Daviesbacteria bacterium RIFCSPLOWO2_01_FULL_43_38]|nr:MAG: hypothetical protein A3A14_01515 [Candidatus Daviesbacteria bacterium RIFCSPLOWO2_01_FULL_43_38]OGE70501.1 MAG: hypothetical protein A3J21_00265 [Candidatus Daviesbacteria bacterium RIFCSPLOWO2_02_FULL_43_11]